MLSLTILNIYGNFKLKNFFIIIFIIIIKNLNFLIIKYKNYKNKILIIYKNIILILIIRNKNIILILIMKYKNIEINY